MTTDNYYDILGVDKNADQDTIKKVYRQKAKEFHPDKGGDESMFKKISEAYEVLGDEGRRNEYDNRNNNPFGGFNPFGDFFGGFNQPRYNQAPDKVITLNIGVVDLFNGVDQEFEYIRNLKCEPCNGEGGEKTRCGTCNGSGVLQRTVSMGLFNQVFTQPCPSCNGEGHTFTKRCGSCSSNGYIPTNQKIKIKIPNGLDEGQFLKLQGKGDFVKGTYGNLVIRINITPQDDFEKIGNDLVYNAFFNLEDLSKDTFDIPHPSSTINVSLPKEFDTSKPLRVRGKGFNGGDLFIKLFVKFIKTN